MRVRPESACMVTFLPPLLFPPGHKNGWDEHAHSPFCLLWMFSSRKIQTCWAQLADSSTLTDLSYDAATRLDQLSELTGKSMNKHSKDRNLN